MATTPTWNIVTGPIIPNYSTVTNPPGVLFDDSSVIFDDPNYYFNGGNVA